MTDDSAGVCECVTWQYMLLLGFGAFQDLLFSQTTLLSSPILAPCSLCAN